MSKKLFMHMISIDALLAAGLTEVNGIGFGAAGFEGEPFIKFGAPLSYDAMAAYDKMNKIGYPMLGKINSAAIDVESGVEKVVPRPVEAVESIMLFTSGTASNPSLYVEGAVGQKYHCGEGIAVATWDDIVPMNATGAQQIAAAAVGGAIASVVIAGIRKS